MSIVSEVLKGAEMVDIDCINKRVPELKDKSEKLKFEALKYVEKLFVKYAHKRNQSQVKLLLQRGNDLEIELSTLHEKASFVSSKDLKKADYELNKNILELQSIDFSLKVVTNTLNLNKLLITFSEELVDQKYLNCAKVLRDVNTAIKNTNADEKLDIISEFEHALVCNKLKLALQLKNIITNFIGIQKFEDGTSVIKISINSPEINEALEAAYFLDEDIEILHDIARKLWEHFFVPIVDSTVLLEEVENLHFVNLSITIQQPGVKSSYNTVFSNIQTLLIFLMKNFNKTIDECLTTLEFIGKDIRDNLSELIIKNCLRHTIPKIASELQAYSVVIEDTKKLEESLLDAKIFTNDTQSILQFANNVDTMFIDKRCEFFLGHATSIMQQDLHDLEEVGKSYDPFDSAPSQFSRCSISKNVPKLLQLGEIMLEEAVEASPEFGRRLFCTLQNIILKYTTFVPEYHKKYFQSLPQLIALFHNNCLYIAYVVTGWNIKYCARLDPSLCSCDFNDEVKQLPLVAQEVLAKYVEAQVKQVNEIMAGAEINGKTIEKLDPKSEKCVRQCLRQQELLKTVWHKVLSYGVYNKTLGVIVDSLCKSIIQSVINFEDINAEAAAHLGELIKLILTRAPKLFTTPEEIPIFVPSWYKLNELHFLLDASLSQIEDRWAAGKGPLALQFQKTELKHIIKALFQNTDRRAALLAKI